MQSSLSKAERWRILSSTKTCKRYKLNRTEIQNHFYQTLIVNSKIFKTLRKPIFEITLCSPQWKSISWKYYSCFSSLHEVIYSCTKPHLQDATSVICRYGIQYVHFIGQLLWALPKSCLSFSNEWQKEGRWIPFNTISRTKLLRTSRIF